MRKLFLILMAFSFVTLAGIAFYPTSDTFAKKVKLESGKIKIPGIVVTDNAGNQIATKRVTILWRYSDVTGDGTFTWGGPPETGDVFRLVCRAIYTFTADFTPHPSWTGQMSAFLWGPLTPTVFRGVGFDDFIPGQSMPGTFIVTQGPDGLPVPGLSLTARLLTNSGFWDPNNGVIPESNSMWGINYTLNFAPGTPRLIPAGTQMTMYSQLNMQHIAIDTCENGWLEFDFIATGGTNSLIQWGPNTASPDCILYPSLEKPPVFYHPCSVLSNIPLCN